MGNNNNSQRLSYRIGPVERDTRKNSLPELPVEIWHHIIGYLDLSSLQVYNNVRVTSPFIKAILDANPLTFEKIKRDHIVKPALIINAAKQNNFDKLKYLHKMGCKIDYSVLVNAIDSGSSLQLVEYCCQNTSATYLHLFRVARENFQLLQLLKKYTGWGYQEHSIPAYFASQGELEKLKWVREHNCGWNEATMRMAVSAGHLHIVKYCHENKCPHNSDLAFYAAMHGHLHVLQYLHEQGYAWGDTLNGAVESDRLDIMKWAVEHGCPTNHRMVCANAAARGSLRFLKYAHEVGCPWDNNVLSIALLKKHNNCAEYARANGLVEQED